MPPLLTRIPVLGIPSSMLLLTFVALLLPSPAPADEAVDACLAQWKNAPFKKGTAPDQIVGTSVKVLGIGKKTFEDTPSEKPRLVLIKPSVNVLGVTSFRLLNPNGWYCFKANVSVLGKIDIEAHCKAKIASNQDDGTNVLGSDESEQGVTVLGTLRIRRQGCEEKKPAPTVVTVTSTVTSTVTNTAVSK